MAGSSPKDGAGDGESWFDLAGTVNAMSQGMADAAARTVNAIADTTRAGVGLASDAYDSCAAGVNAGARAVASTAQCAYRGTADLVAAAATAGNAALSTEIATSLDRYLRDLFDGKPTAYDKAMDAAHIEQSMGPHHRLFDGGHDLSSAWEASRGAVPDDTFSQEVFGYMGALWKDVVTPNGLPVSTFDMGSFAETSAFLSDTLGLSYGWLADLASYTATELGGATIGALAVSLGWSKAETDRFASMAASLGITAATSGNPILLVVSLVTLARAFQQALDKRAGLLAVVDGLAKGGMGTGVLVSLSALIGGPAWIGLMVGIVGAMLVHKLYDEGRARMPELPISEWVTYAMAAVTGPGRASPPGVAA